jgi:hypothetical protein
MKDEKHRLLGLEAYQAYVSGKLPVETLQLRDLDIDNFKTALGQGRLIYVLRLAPSGMKNPSIAAIPNHNDPCAILYIGGHESGTNTERYKKMVSACLKAEDTFVRNGYAENDKKHDHSVANRLTTSLLQLGFSIKDCWVDIVDGGQSFDELELLIGYEETFHHLPPWNNKRAGALAYIG